MSTEPKFLGATPTLERLLDGHPDEIVSARRGDIRAIVNGEWAAARRAFAKRERELEARISSQLARLEEIYGLAPPPTQSGAPIDCEQETNV